MFQIKFIKATVHADHITGYCLMAHANNCYKKAV